MNDRCPTCGLHFNREPGYFLGAMYISYGLGLAVIGVLWGFVVRHLQNYKALLCYATPQRPRLTRKSRSVDHAKTSAR